MKLPQHEYRPLATKLTAIRNCEHTSPFGGDSLWKDKEEGAILLTWAREKTVRQIGPLAVPYKRLAYNLLMGDPVEGPLIALSLNSHGPHDLSVEHNYETILPSDPADWDQPMETELLSSPNEVSPVDIIRLHHVLDRRIEQLPPPVPINPTWPHLSSGWGGF